MRWCHNGHPVLSTPRLDCFVRALKQLLYYTDLLWRYYVENSKSLAISCLAFLYPAVPCPAISCPSFSAPPPVRLLKLRGQRALPLPFGHYLFLTALK